MLAMYMALCCGFHMILFAEWTFLSYFIGHHRKFYVKGTCTSLVEWTFYYAVMQKAEKEIENM